MYVGMIHTCVRAAGYNLPRITAKREPATSDRTFDENPETKKKGGGQGGGGREEQREKKRATATEKLTKQNEDGAETFTFHLPPANMLCSHGG